MNVLILGANGFIGSHLCEQILQQTNWNISALDLHKDNLQNCLNNERFDFRQGDADENHEWIVSAIQQCDVILPLIAIANPQVYIQKPIQVFELDFELNLKIIKLCAKYHKRIIFPSSSEVYGMCSDSEFNEESSNLVTGPINKQRWIYSTSKQLLDRVIYAYGLHKDLPYTIFRPFNWIGPRLDKISDDKNNTSRSLTLFISNILYTHEIKLVNGGEQRRSFTYINDAIEALLKIIENPNNVAAQEIFNIGNPQNDISISEFVKILCTEFRKFPKYAHLIDKLKISKIKDSQHFGKYYQDTDFRIPCIKKIQKSLSWYPETSVNKAIYNTLDYYLNTK